MPFVFAGYRYDADAGLRFGTQRIVLPPKERDLLEFLLASHGRVVSKDAVVEAVWNGGVASDESIARAVYRLRLAMQAAGGPPVVSTVYNGGYRLSAPIELIADPIAVSAEPAALGVRSTLCQTLIAASREFGARRSLADVHQAVQAAAAAAALAPEDPLAWVAVAQIQTAHVMRCMGSPRVVAQQARRAVDEALALNPQCGPALAVRGWLQALVLGDLRAGAIDLDRALLLDAQCWWVSYLRSPVMQALGSHAEAIAMARQVRVLNPEGLWGVDVLPVQLLLGGQLEGALASARQLALRFPSVECAHAVLSVALSVVGALDESLQVLEQALAWGLNSSAIQGQRAYVLARLGRFFDARRALALMDIPGTEPAYAAQVMAYLALGQPAQASACWLQAKAAGAPQYFTIFDDPRWDSVARRADYRWVLHA